MPVNMDPAKKRRKTPEAKEPPKAADATPHGSAKAARLPDEATERDRGPHRKGRFRAHDPVAVGGPQDDSHEKQGQHDLEAERRG